MASTSTTCVTTVVLLLLLLFVETCVGQQSYVNNRQLNCYVNDTTTLGFVCNSPSSPSCPSYLTFRSTLAYNTPASIASLLSADASRIAALNNISSSDSSSPLPPDTLLIVPVNCSCFGSIYYQHNASYVLRRLGETYFTVANDTYQALTTCQSMEAQNPSYNFRSLFPNLRLTVPLRCACPTPIQTAAGFRYLLTYLVRQGDSPDSIAAAFSGAGADVQSVLDANELSRDQVIFYFTPLLVPLRTQPTWENINDNTSPPPTIPTTPTGTGTGTGGGSSNKWVFFGAGFGAAGVLFLLCSSGFLVWFFRYRRRRQSPSEKDRLGDPSVPAVVIPLSSSMDTLMVYKFEELEKATGSFAEANRIGASSVFRGWFKGDAAAVKIMKGDVSPEISVLRQINHSHIVRLSGFCLHQGITYLVYEYAHNGSLTDCLQQDHDGRDDDALSKNNNNNNNKNAAIKITSSPLSRNLDWKQRVQIACDVADALNYLHNYTTPPYIHMNLKSSNILLDSNTRAKVANFSLARPLEDHDDDRDAQITRHVVGTYGYMAPEYIENGLVTPKIDVFALGVVMLELLSGRQPILNHNNDFVGDEQKYVLREEKSVSLPLAHSIQEVLSGDNVREKLREFMDPRLGRAYPFELAYSMAELARSCVDPHLNSRPPVSEVFMALSKLLSTSLDWDPSDHDDQLHHSTSFSLSD